MNPTARSLDDTHLLTQQAPISTRSTQRPVAERPTATSFAAVGVANDLPTSLDAIEKRAIVEALEKTGGNQSAAARLLGMGRHALIGRMEAYDLARPRKDRL